ncbi:MAG: homoaconitate hydratase family protein [Candidatus Aminicenantes bacterium]|nr:homoaconitate hydratase family protein [Candidatus Aminicenantes bacterium]
MGKTIIEKIIQAHTDDDAAPRKIVWMGLDVRSARDFGGPNVVKNYEREYSGLPLADKKKTFFTFDLCVPASSLKYADAQQVCRDFAQKHDIKVFDVNKGIGSHVLIEEGLAGANSTVVGTDSHLNILGAVGCFGQGMGDVDIAFAFRTGKTWFEVPETIKVLLKGDFSYPATAKDLTLKVLKELGTKRAALKAVEFYGEAVRELSLSGRITLCSMVTEMAGVIGFIPEFEDSFRKEIEGISKTEFNPVQADEDCHYSEVIEISIDRLAPQVAVPFSPDNVQDISELKGTKIHSGFIGSCTNGRTEDLALAARELNEKKVKEDVMLKVVPATARVYEELLEQGILQALFRAGAIISNPGCGGCAEGHIGLTGEGEVQISTGNRNFEGKQGKGKTYLASPAVVAASCVRGEIASPEDL